MKLSRILFFLCVSCAEAQLNPQSIPHGEIAIGDFAPLSCNDDIDQVVCESWKSQNYDFSLMVTIPCGKCVTFDEDPGEKIILDLGLSIVGKLVFPPDTKATIETPFIFVQGKLEASSNAIVNEENIDSLNIILSQTASRSFYPHEDNKAACGNYFCDAGKKAILVAGGQLDIKGLSDSCPTWVNLYDVVEDSSAFLPDKYPMVPTPPTGCERRVLHEEFEDGRGPFKSSLGCIGTVETEDSTSNKYYHISARTRSWQGAFMNVDSDFRDCILSKQTYLVKTKYRLVHEDPGSFSNCHTNGEDCLALNVHTMTNGTMGWKVLYQTPPIAKSVDGNWTDFVAAIEFDETFFDPISTYQVVYFAGPEGGVNIDIDDVFISLPWEEQFPVADDKICENLVVNGDAEVDDKFIYPFELIGNLGSHVRIKTENDINGAPNKYFSVTGRTAGWTSIYQSMLEDCIVKNSVYSFALKVRVHSVELSNVRLILKTFSGESNEYDLNYSYEAIGHCPPASKSTGWVFCESKFLFTETHQNATKIDFQLIVENNDVDDVDYDDISIILHAPPVNKLIVSADVAQCWGVGAEIVQTSHTISHEDYNELTITAIEVVGEYAHVTVDTPIAKPTTVKDDSRFAIEVALLSRNIVMQSKDDDPSQPFHGGHLMVIHTPDVAQNIHGIDFRGFGQQGLEARYPVHFHMCGNVNGTVVARNTVRQSNQRCYVVHATNAVHLEYNIAFDTFGHCFMLEDGIEEENSFFYNLGLETKIMPDSKVLSLEESDMFPATFWASNPKNYFLGNVAAGGEDTGFWYEFLTTVRGSSTNLDPSYQKNPSETPMGYHKHNVMHSYVGDGFKLYPNGYFPEDRAIFENVRSFRNAGDGVLLHNSKNLGLDGGVFADNRRQIEVDKQADDVTVSNAVVIGFSPLYQIEVEAGNRKSHCPAWRPLVGIQLHSFLRYRDSKGYTLSNITFEDFGEETGCVGSVAIEMDEQVRDGHFDAYSSFHNLTFPQGSSLSEKFSMCALKENELFFDDLVIQDMDGDLNPAGDLPGVIVSNSDKMIAFSDNCVEMPGTCALYCEGKQACYRALNIATWNAPDYKDLVLEVTDSTGKTMDFAGYFHIYMKPAVGGEIEDEYENTVFQRRRYYSPIVPYGNYTMKFKKEGAPYWPQFIELVWEDPPPCNPHIDENTTKLEIPPPSEVDCFNLLRNYDAGLGDYSFWSHSGGGVKVVEYEDGKYAISSIHRTGAWHGFGQYLDTRCLVEGSQFEIIVKIRLQNSDGEFVVCNINRVDYNAGDACPRVSFRMRKLLGNKIGDGVESKYAYPMANAVGPWKADDWNTLYGKFTVTEAIAESDSVYFFIDRARPGVNIMIDFVLVIPTIHGCQMPIYNGDFEVGDTRFWRTIGSTEIDIYDTGYSGESSLRTTKRKEWWGSMIQDLNKDCLFKGDKFSVSAMVMFLDADENIYDCNPSLQWGVDANMDKVCPTIALRLTTGSQIEDIDIGAMPGPITEGLWNNIFGQFEVDDSIMEADLVSIYFRKLKAGINIAVDDFVVTKLSDSEGGNEIVQNGDFSSGDARYFHIHGGGSISVVEDSIDPTEKYLIVEKRTRSDYGVRYAIDTTPLSSSIMYRISVDLRLTTEEWYGFSCDPGTMEAESKCPILYLRSQFIGKKQLMTRPIASAPSDFKPSEWNTFSSYFQFLESEIKADSLYLIINDAPPNAVMFLDNLKIYAPKLGTAVPSMQPSESLRPSVSPSKMHSLNPTRFNRTD